LRGEDATLVRCAPTTANAGRAMKRVTVSPVTKTSHSVVVLQRTVTKELSTYKRSSKDIPVVLAKAREVTVNIVAEPESSMAMVSAITKLSHTVPNKASTFANKRSVKFVKLECSLTMTFGIKCISHELTKVTHLCVPYISGPITAEGPLVPAASTRGRFPIHVRISRVRTLLKSLATVVTLESQE
jgi:hypothetical protein